MIKSLRQIVGRKLSGQTVGMLAAVVAGSLLSSRAGAQTSWGNGGSQGSTTPSTTANKSGYNLFDMTPENLRRPFYTDHGAMSPYTLDAGAYAIGAWGSYGYRDRQVMMTYDHTTEAWNFGAVVKAGIFNDFDLEVRVPEYETGRSTYKSYYGSDSYGFHGWTDMALTGKLNLIGNDGGPIAWGVAGTVTFPTACYQIDPYDQYTGGLSSLFDYTCPCGWEFRMVNGFLLSDYDCWESDFCDDVCVLSPYFLTDARAYVGFDSNVSTSNDSNWDGSFKIGATYNLSPNMQLFAQSDFGVNGAVADYMPSFGFDFRY
jgi:hypothetical protein